MSSSKKDEGGISPLGSPIDEDRGVLTDEKPGVYAQDMETSSLEHKIEQELNVTEDDLLEAKAVAGNMSTEQVIALMKNVLKIHERDPNFPHEILIRIDEFLGEYHHSPLVQQRKLLTTQPTKRFSRTQRSMRRSSMR